MVKIDACGLACPEPMVLLKKQIKENEIVLLVDSQTAAANCTRFAKDNGFLVMENVTGAVHELVLTKENA